MRRIIVGMSGASGVIYGIRLLEVLRDMKQETHLVMSEAAKRNILIETDYLVEEVEGIASHVHDTRDLAAPISSGSFRTDGMAITPCAIKTLSGVAHSYNDNLLIRAADVTLKEKRKLVLVVRETPLHKGHLELMHRVSDLGGIILPPIPAFYIHPKTIDDIVNHTIGKILDIMCIDHNLYRRWKGPNKTKERPRPSEE
ncbi:MAG: UbiX family flavin prenyltransferase [Deltaproteobacteria bacterium]|nr:UbiX family flavin prenyltransferase [Deltaproteobacteria bacterium]